MPVVRYVIVVLVACALGLIVKPVLEYRETLKAFSVASEVHRRKKAEYLKSLRSVNGKGGNGVNFITILLDDAGFDFSCFGNKAIQTPHIDALAARSTIKQKCYSGHPVCTPSRASLITGRYAARTGLGTFPSGLVLFPHQTWIATFLSWFGFSEGLNQDEISIGDVFSNAGWRTGFVGKWHLGSKSPYLPNDFGFESFFGTLYSNDMAPFDLWANKTVHTPHEEVDQKLLTPLFGDESIKFIEQSIAAGDNFFLQLATNAPHDPLWVRDEMLGTSNGGLYGDVIAELDRMVGRLEEALERLGAQDNTMVWLTSDNGPWFEGWNGGYRERKSHHWEGGQAVPCIVNLPGLGAEARVRRHFQQHPGAIIHATDMFRTMVDLASLPLPTDRVYDGRSLFRAEELDDDGEGGSRTVHFVFGLGDLASIRQGNFKLHLQHSILRDTELVHNRSLGQREFDGRNGHFMWLVDLEHDPHEAYDASAKHPKLAEAMATTARSWANSFKMNPRGWKGDNDDHL